jgi:orotidine-5'-phosphate decarboxylase
MRNPILVALDVANGKTALRLAEQLREVIGGYKIGSELFTAEGPGIVRQIHAFGAPVFLDLKFHDIPSTVAKAVAAAVELEVQFLTLHTSGGSEMMRAAESAAQLSARQRGSQPPLVLGVTVLTSLDQAAVSEIGMAVDPAQQVERLALLAQRAGLRGLVCSAWEIARLRRLLTPEMQLVIPGIRPDGDTANDQKRTLTPAEAMRAGADWLVIGRPICAARQPREAAERILATLV